MQNKQFKNKFSLSLKKHIKRNKNRTFFIVQTHFQKKKIWKYESTYEICKKKIINNFFFLYYNWKQYWEKIFQNYLNLIIFSELLNFLILVFSTSTKKKLTFKARCLNKINNFSNNLKNFLKKPSEKSRKMFGINFLKKSPVLLFGIFSQIIGLIFLLKYHSEFFIFTQIKPFNFFEYNIYFTFSVVIIVFIILNLFCLIIPFIFFSKKYNEKIFYWISKFFFLYCQKALVLEFLGPLCFLAIKYGDNFTKSNEEKLNFIKDYLINCKTELKSILKTDYFVLDLNLGKEDRIKIIHDLTKLIIKFRKEIDPKLNLREFQNYYNHKIKELFENTNELNSFFTDKDGILVSITKKIIDPFLLKNEITKEIIQNEVSLWNYLTNNGDPKTILLYIIGIVGAIGLVIFLFKPSTPSSIPNAPGITSASSTWNPSSIPPSSLRVSSDLTDRLKVILYNYPNVDIEQKKAIIALFPIILTGIHTKQEHCNWHKTIYWLNTIENKDMLNLILTLWKPTDIILKQNNWEDLSIFEYEVYQFYTLYILPFKIKYLNLYEILEGVLNWVKNK